jgi:cytochrome c oxidase cbb3-type subunit 3
VVDGSYLGLTSDRLLRTIVLVGRPHLGMPDWRSMALGRPMSDAEVADVVAWLAARRPVHPGEPYPTEAQADG